MTLKKGQVPQCRSCGKDHWPFVRCENLSDWKANADKLKERNAVYWVQQPREGFSAWGDRMGQYLNLGGNLVLDRPIKQGGNVRVPEEWGWETDPGKREIE